MERLDPGDAVAKDLLSPDWSVVEGHFGAIAPGILKDLYRDPDRLLLQNFDLISDLSKIGDGLHVELFVGTGEDSLIGAFDDLERYLPIARGPGGEEYVIDISEADPEDFFYQYDVGDDPEKLQFTGLRLSEFLMAKRVPAVEDYGE